MCHSMQRSLSPASSPAPTRRLVAACERAARAPAHASLAAAICWRSCQLLTALPNRGREAAAWAAAAQRLWSAAGTQVSSMSLQVVLGDDVALKGQGSHGHGAGAVISIATRRLLPPLLPL